jgi:hypothetical protein
MFAHVPAGKIGQHSRNIRSASANPTIGYMVTTDCVCVWAMAVSSSVMSIDTVLCTECANSVLANSSVCLTICIVLCVCCHHTPQGVDVRTMLGLCTKAAYTKHNNTRYCCDPLLSKTTPFLEARQQSAYCNDYTKPGQQTYKQAYTHKPVCTMHAAICALTCGG